MAVNFPRWSAAPCVLAALLPAAGCAATSAMPARVEAQVAAVTPLRATFGPITRPHSEPGASATGVIGASATEVVETPKDLPGLWRLAAANNPGLREAAADVEAARGQQIQAGRYPNPHFAYAQDLIGSRTAPAGNIALQITQEIVTAGKRRLDMAIADRETTAAFCGLMSRKSEVQTRLRRSYYAYLGAVEAVELNGAAVASLQTGVATTRKLVETVQTRPRTDLLRLESLLEETRISLDKSRFNVEAAWKQVAAEVGLPGLPAPKTVPGFSAHSPLLQTNEIWQRVQAANTALRRASVEAESARLNVERARAEAIPNITVGGGYANAPIELTAGAIITLEAPIPVWDLKQGHIHDAQARYAKAQAAVRSLETALSSTIAEAFARYQGARRQADKLSQEVLPRLQESVDLLLKNYELGISGVTLTDVITTQESLIDSRLRLSETRQTLWQAIADLQGFMQLDIDE